MARGLRHRIRETVLKPVRRWLSKEAELDVRWHGIAGLELHLGAAELNAEEIGHEALRSSPLVLQRATIRSLRFTFSLVGAPAMVLDVEGLRVEVSARPVEDSYWSETKMDSEEQERRKKLAAIDPEGSAEHARAEKLVKRGMFWDFFLRLLTAFLLSAIRIELRGVQMLYHCEQLQQHACISASHSIFPEGPSNSFFKGSMLASSLDSIAAAFRKTPFSKRSSISDLSLQFKRSGPSTKPVPPGEHAVLVMMLVVSFNFCQAAFSNLSLDIPEAVVGLESREADVLITIVNELQGPDSIKETNAGAARSLEQVLPRERTSKELWTWAVAKILESSPLRTLGRTLEAGLLRRRYATLYSRWLQEIGWRERRTGPPQGDSLKKLFAALCQIEKQLPVEAVALARLVSRRQRMAALMNEPVDTSKHQNGFKLALEKLRSFPRLWNTNEDGKDLPSGRRWVGKFSANFSRGSAIFLACDSSKCIRGVGLCLRWRKASASYGSAGSVVGYSLVCGSLVGQLISVSIEDKQEMNQSRSERKGRWDGRMLDHFTFFSGSGVQEKEGVMEKYNTEVQAAYLAVRNEERRSWRDVPWMALDREEEAAETPFLLAVYEESSAESVNEPSLISSLVLDVGKADITLYDSMFGQALPLISQVEKYLDIKGSSTNDPRGETVPSRLDVYYKEQVLKYFDSLRDLLFSAVPDKHLHVSVVVQSVQLQLLVSCVSAKEVPNSFVFDFGYWNVMLWPPEEEGTGSRNPDGASSTVTRRWIRPPPPVVLPSVEGYLEHVQVGLNFVAYMNGVSVTRRKGEFLCQRIVEPFTFAVESSSCRDDFSSFFDSFKALSLSATVNVPSLVIDLRLNRLTALLECLISFEAELLKHLPKGVSAAGSAPRQNEGERPRRINKCFAICFSAALEGLKIYVGDEESSESAAEDSYIALTSGWLHSAFGDGLTTSICSEFQNLKFHLVSLDSDLTTRSRRQLLVDELIGDHFIISLYDTSTGDDTSQRQACKLSQLDDFGKVREELYCSMEVDVGNVLVASCCTDDLMAKALTYPSASENMRLQLALEKDTRKCIFDMEGGLLLVHTASVVRILNVIEKYLDRSSELSTSRKNDHDSTNRLQQTGRSIPRSYSLPDRGQFSNNLVPFRSQSSPEDVFKNVDDFLVEGILSMKVSGFSLVAATTGVSGRSMEGILLGFSGTCLVEMHLSSCKIRADISQFELITFQDQKQQESRGKRPIPQFGLRASENNNTAEKDEIRGYAGANEASRLDYILDGFTSSLLLTKRAVLNPKWKTCWQGHVSATGLHIALTTHEVQMVLSIVSPLSGVSSGPGQATEKRAYSEAERRSWSELPDGAIIAIKDTEEHLYLAVEESVTEGHCHLGGVWHYSVAGGKALFQVKYQEGSKGDSWFSLLSLHAKNSDGVPLRVHYRPGSRQVEISSTNDGSWELWQCKPCRTDSASEFDAYSGMFGNLVYLINQKSKQGIACVDGVPTFSRPGNPFKIQVVAQVDPAHRMGSSSSQEKLATTNLISTSSAAVMPHVALDMGSVSITLLHEAAGVVHLLPLVRLRLDEAQGLMQLSSYKMRTIASCNLVLEHYEAQSSSWLSIVNPVVTNFFWSSRSGPAADRHVKVPSTMFCRLKKVDVLVSELSLDACLFLIGVMDLAGPFTLHHSPVLVNRCQIENQTGLSLLCRFDRGTGGQEEGKVPSWQSKSYLMRHVTSRTGTTPAEVSTSVTIHLEKPGKGFSSSITLALGDPGVLAVRTRLEAFQDSRLNAPGPIVVIDISKQSQDGICLTVSPMVKIHNATGLALQLRCRRPQQSDEKGAIVSLKDGDIIDDAMGSFDAMSLEGEMKKALLSFNVGNFLLSIRPESSEGENNRTYEWSEDVKGAKAVRASGLFDKLNYSFKRTLKSKSLDFSFGSVFCTSSGNEDADGLHFLIRTSRRQVPVTKISNEEQHKRSLIAWQEQQELLLLPTLRVSNFLSSAVHVQVATSTNGVKNSMSGANEVTISEKVGRTSLYVDLTALFLVLKHADSGLVSDPVDISTGHKRYQELAKKGGNIKDLDMDINFKDGLHTALLKVYRADDGVLELAIFTKYAFVNDSEVSIICCPTKSSSKWGTRRSRTLQWPSSVPTMRLPPNSFTSWLYKSNNLLLKRDEQGAQPAPLDLESLSGSLEVSLGVQTVNSVDRIQLGVSLRVPYEVDSAPSHIVRMAPRYTVANDSAKEICVCQDGFEDDEQKHFTVAQGGKVAVHVQEQKEGSDKSVSEGMDKQQTSALSLRFRFQESGWRWSGRVNAASLGSFFLKLQRDEDASRKQFAILSVEENAASLTVRFRLRNAEPLPYRVENKLHSASVTFHQMGMTESESLMPGTSTDYVWDDLSMQHRLVITVAGTGTQACSDVNLDKIKAWRSFAAAHRKKGFSLQLPFEGKLGGNERESDELLENGYEVYADGQTRVLRICEKADSTKKSYWQSEMSLPRQKVELRIPILRVFMIETGKQKIEDLTGEDLTGSSSAFMPFLCAVMTSVSTEVLVTVEYTFCHFKVQGLGIDMKWPGAPFAAMLRLHDHDRLNKSTIALQAASVLANSGTNPIQVKYSSMLLQAFDLNIDEDTLLKLVPFYRTSLSTSTTSRQIYFERFEIHPIKIVASFVPGNPRTDYTSTQETFRSLLHTVIKLPSVRGATVELNGVLLSHALLTFRQLAIKCVQHYSWYAMRAIYIARGSKLLPPGFASLFDDSAASSLDVFFDPSSGSIDLQGLTLGMFNLLSRGLRKKGQGGTSRYLGDLEKTVKKAGSNIMFAVVTELSDNVLKGAEANGLEGMINGFRRGVLNVAMQPLALQKAVVRGGPTRRIQLDRSVGTDEAYVEGYLQATLDAAFKQEYLKVKVMEDQLILKNLPPNSMLMNDIITCVRNFLIGEGLLAGEVSSSVGRSLRFLRGDQERKTVPAVISLGEQLLVIFAIRGLRQYTKNIFHIPSSLGKFSKSGASAADKEPDGAASTSSQQQPAPVERPNLKRAVGNFFISSAVAYVDGRLCRHIPNELARRIVSGFLLTFVE